MIRVLRIWGPFGSLGISGFCASGFRSLGHERLAFQVEGLGFKFEGVGDWSFGVP